NAVVLRSLPVRDPQDLVLLDIRDAKHASEKGDPYFTNPIWEEIRDHTHVFTGSFAYANRVFNLANGGIVRHAPVAVVSGGFADRELGGAAAAVGRTLSLDGHPVPVVGVADPRFFGIEVGRKA